jgi:Prokaryotic membrane lipoprotein lipid attachment site
MRRIIITLTAVAFLAGCSPSKQLNETTGRDLLEQEISKTQFMTPVSEVQHLLVRTQTDYASTSASGKNMAAVMKRLLDKGMVTAKVEVLTYPKISGKFVASPSPVCAGRVSVGDTISLENIPSSDAVKGEFVQTGCDGSEQREPVEGTVTSDGALSLGIGGSWLQTRASYEEHGGAADIRFSLLKGYQSTDICRGKATGQKVEVKWYEYSFTPGFAGKITTADTGPAFAAGSIEVKEVSNLRLDTETRAECTFSWEVALNNEGVAFYGTDKQTGKGQASFGKKPDGSWMVLNWGLH